MTKEASYQIDCACAMNLCQNIGRAMALPALPVPPGLARAPVGKTAKTSCPRNTPDTTSSCFGFKAAYPKSCAALFAAISTSRLSSISSLRKH